MLSTNQPKVEHFWFTQLKYENCFFFFLTIFMLTRNDIHNTHADSVPAAVYNNGTDTHVNSTLHAIFSCACSLPLTHSLFLLILSRFSILYSVILSFWISAYDIGLGTQRVFFFSEFSKNAAFHLRIRKTVVLVFVLETTRYYSFGWFNFCSHFSLVHSVSFCLIVHSSAKFSGWFDFSLSVCFFFISLNFCCCCQVFEIRCYSSPRIEWRTK